MPDNQNGRIDNMAPITDNRNKAISTVIMVAIFAAIITVVAFS